GPADARNVQVVDEAPAGLTYQGVDPVAGDWSASGGGADSADVIFTLDGAQKVGPDHETSFVATFTTDSGVAPDTALHYRVEPSPESCTNTPPVNDSTSSKRVAGLGIVKTYEGETVTAGETLPYTLTVTIHGPSVSDGPIEISDDELPAGFSYEPGS